MVKILSALHLLALLLSSLYVTGQSSLVESTCKRTPFYDLCLATLRANPKSATADVPGLGLIAVEALSAEAQRTLSRINQLRKATGDGGLRRALGSCADKYAAILKADVPEAVEALTKGNPKFAEMGANDAAIEANSCERDLGAKSPIGPNNKRVHDLSVVAASISKLLE